MLYQEFDRNKARWDLFDAPHIVDGLFVRFATGEVICTGSAPGPNQRRLYRDYGIQIAATDDHDCPELFVSPDAEKPLPRAWLSQRGQQYLAIDHEQGVAVNLTGSVSWRYTSVRPDTHLRDEDKRVPHYLTRRFAAYWGGPGRLPVGAPVRVSSPYKPTPEQRKHLQSLSDQAHAWAALKDLPDHPVKMPVTQPMHVYFDKTFTELPDVLKESLYRCGWATFREETEMPYLYIRKP